MRFFNDTTRLFAQIGTLGDRAACIEILTLVYADRKKKWFAKNLPKDLETHGANVLAAFYREKLPK